jgi:hypothetical protein
MVGDAEMHAEGKPVSKWLRWMFRALLLAVPLIGVGILTSGQFKARSLSPDLQRFVDKFHQVTVGMTEADVEAILGQYGATRTYEKREANNRGEPFTRPSAIMTSFYDKAPANTSEHTKVIYYADEANESDHFIDVFFDEEGLVVGKSIGVLWR